MFRSLLYLVIFFISFISYSQDLENELFNARKLYKEKKYAESAHRYSKIEKKVPNTYEFKHELAQNYFKINKFDKAEKNYLSSLDKCKNSSEKAITYYNLGNTYLKQQKYSEAIESYKKSLRLNSKDEECRFNLAKALKNQNSSQNKNQNNSTNNKNNQNSSSSKSKNNGDKQSEQNKVDRILDELRKNEAETKNKANSNRSEHNRNKKNNNIKDW